ncbi:MAG: TonB-dependent vitamin B12 receptor [Betaproteobacteria bacterium]|nr:TonB-dependent vitamin B12 receptor [Betaproteobacteria bacterium]
MPSKRFPAASAAQWLRSRPVPLHSASLEKTPALLAALLLPCLPLGNAHAAEPELDPVIVTATRTAQTADETLAAVTVVTREEIDRLQARSVTDLLSGMSGISLANSGGRGQQTSFFLRGTNSSHTVFMIDGIQVDSPTTGMTAIENIPLDQIDRIEIVRGPRSSLYGSEAIGGVVQIFTRKAQSGDGVFKPVFSIGAGRYSTFEGHAGASGVFGENGRGWYNVGIGGMSTNGFNSCRGSMTAGCFTVEPDDDGYRNQSVSLSTGYRFDKLEAQIQWLRTESRLEYDGSYGNETKSMNQVLGGKLRFSPADNFQATLSVGRSWDNAHDYLNGVYQDFFNTHRNTASLQADWTFLPQHTLSLGVDYQNEKVDADLPYDRDSRSNTGVFAQYQGRFGQFDTQAALRSDDNQQFGQKTTGNLSLGFNFENRMRLWASYGTAFKAPSFNDLYYPYYGNPNLRPETSKSWELGFSTPLALGEGTKGSKFSLNAFYTDIDDLIAYDSNTFAPANINTARILGVEANLRLRLSAWSINASATWLDPKNRTDGAMNGNLLPRRARESFRIDADYNFGSWRLGATLRGEGNRYDDLANTERMGGYALTDLRAEVALDKKWSLQGRFSNIFDKKYETAAWYNQPGRALFVTLRYQ